MLGFAICIALGVSLRAVKKKCELQFLERRRTTLAPSGRNAVAKMEVCLPYRSNSHSTLP